MEHVNELSGEYRYKLSVGDVRYGSNVFVNKWGSIDNGIRVIILHVQVGMLVNLMLDVCSVVNA